MDLDRPIRAAGLLGLGALLLLASPAASLELFEGNLGSDGEWLHVLDAPAMSNRVYWTDLGEDVTYRVQCAADEGFSQLVVDEGGIVENWIEPALAPGLYAVRVREVHDSGLAGSWSEPGGLEVVADFEAPAAGVLYPADGDTFQQGDTVSVALEVSDDTVLHLARFSVNGEYAGTLGLKAENYKLAPSFGVPRTVAFDVALPARGKAGPVEISVVVSDVTYKQVTRTVVIRTEKAGDADKGGRGRKK